MNIPIFRAKQIDGDEWVEGYYHKVHRAVDVGYGDIEKGEYIFDVEDGITAYDIDTKTLAIHFPNMIDKNGTKIFASLSKDGIGGDIVDVGYNYIREPMIMGKIIYVYNYDNSEVIGIYNEQ